jgi:hypothetical protein
MDPICYCIKIHCPDNLLLFGIFATFLGFMSIGRLMLVAGKFVVDENGNRISVMRLEVPKNVEAFTTTLSKMTEKSKYAARLNLNLDFLFMPFLYMCMYFIATYVQLRFEYNHAITDAWMTGLIVIRFLPFLTWLLDIAENLFTLMALKKPGKALVNLMRFVSVLKWLTGAVFVGYWLLLGIWFLFILLHFHFPTCSSL